jgi:hypothetical protein
MHDSRDVAVPDHYAQMDRLGDEIAELSAHLEAATARLLACGELSYAKVRALTRVATPETEERLLAVGKAGTAAHVERIVRGWRRVDRIAEAREAVRRHASRSLHVYQDEDGMTVVRGRLDPEAGALLVQALTAAREKLYPYVPRAEVVMDPPTMGQQQADALALLAETTLHRGIDPGSPGERYQVVVHVDAPVLTNDTRFRGNALAPGPARGCRPRGSRCARPVSARRRHPRFRGNVSAPGVRREPGGDAPRPRRPTGRGLGADADDLSGATPCAAASRPRRTAFRAADCRSARAITSSTGRTAAPPRCRTWRCCVAATTAPSTKRVTSWSDYRMARFGSGGQPGYSCPMCRLLRRCPPILCGPCESEMRRRDCAWTPIPRRPAGSESGWT